VFEGKEWRIIPYSLWDKDRRIVDLIFLWYLTTLFQHLTLSETSDMRRRQLLCVDKDLLGGGCRNFSLLFLHSPGQTEEEHIRIRVVYIPADI
jgi:hypothetical protein